VSLTEYLTSFFASFHAMLDYRPTGIVIMLLSKSGPNIACKASVSWIAMSFIAVYWDEFFTTIRPSGNLVSRSPLGRTSFMMPFGYNFVLTPSECTSYLKQN
jgi:hypothetical protein